MLGATLRIESGRVEYVHRQPPCLFGQHGLLLSKGFLSKLGAQTATRVVGKAEVDGLWDTQAAWTGGSDIGMEGCSSCAVAVLGL